MKKLSQLIKLKGVARMIIAITLSFYSFKSQSQTFTVNTLVIGDNNANSCGAAAGLTSGDFIQALQEANAGNISDIQFSVSGTINLTSHWPGAILCAGTNNITITGPVGGITLSDNDWQAALEIRGNNNVITGIDFNGRLWITGGDNNRIDDCSFNIGGSYQGVEIDNSGNNNIIENSTFVKTVATDHNGVFVRGASNGNTIRFCSFDAFWDGIEVRGTSPNTTIYGNTMINSINAGIYVWENSVGAIIDSNIVHSGFVVSVPSGSVGSAFGIVLENSSTLSNPSSITRNVVGTDATETADLGNDGHGIRINGGSYVTVGGPGMGNLVVHNGNSGLVTDGLQATGHGIFLESGVTNSIIQSNIIGTDRLGTQDYGNDMSGIYIERLTESLATNDINLIGGPNIGEGNLIGNNGSAHIPFLATNTYAGPRSGIQIWQSHGNIVQGNLIGTNGSGSNIGNYQEAITLNGAKRNQIGGSSTAEANILTNSRNGIALRYGSQWPSNVTANYNIITGNIIGTDLSGNTGLGNNSNGISIETESDGNTIGGSSSTEGNLIVATVAGPGIWLSGADNNEIYNNQIGYNLGLGVPLHENALNGILVEAGSQNNTIGSTTAGNTISNKTSSSAAISISGALSTGNTIVGNITSCNAGRGIELNNTGNNNYASSGSGTSAQLFVNTSSTSGNYFGVAPANARIDIYDIGTCNACSGSDNGLQQGALWRGFVTADASGDWTSTITSTNGIVVTATDASGNTSEFSQCVTVCTSPGTATITPSSSEICQGETSILTATPAGFDYTWYDGSGVVGSNQTFNATSTGTYYVVIADPADPNNPTCQVQSSNATVTVHSLPSAGTISGADPVCEGSTETYSTTTSTGVTYDWSTSEGSIASANGSSSIDIDFSGASNGTITLEVEDGNTCTNSATFDFTVNATPNTTGITGETTVCEDVIGEIYTASSDFGTSYTWTVSGDATYNSGPGANQITVDFGSISPINITATAVSGTSPNQCADQTPSQISVVVNSLPSTPTINGAQTLACNTSDEPYSVSVPNATSTYAWTVPSGATKDLPDDGSDITVDFGTNGGNITVIETNSAGCSSGQASRAVTLNGCGLEANFNVSSDSVCEGGSITFTDNSNASVAVESWAWDFGTGAIPATATGQGPHDVVYSTAGTATVTLVVNEGVATDDTIAVNVITINSTPTTAGTISGASPVCANTIGEVYDVAPSNATSTYAWTSPGTIQPGGNIGPGNDQILIDFGTTGGTIRVIETTQSGCVSPESTFDVAIDDVPVLTGPINQPSTTICDEDFGQQYTFSFPSVSNEDALVWSVPSGATIVSGQGTNSIVVDFANSGSNQTVSVDATNTCGTSSLTSDAFEIVETTPIEVLISGGGQSVCANVNVDYTATHFFVDPSGVTYTWYVDGVAQSGSNSDQFTWDNPGFAQTIAVEVTPNSLECVDQASDTSTADPNTILPTPNAEAGDDQILEDLEQVILSGGTNETLTTPQTGETYSWTSSVDNGELINPDPNSVFETVRADPTEDITTYYFTVNNGSCADTDSMQVIVEFSVWVPTGFSPNNDEINDGFQIKNIERYPGNRVEVYNRWGSLVFESDSYGVNGAEWWDGTYNGKDLPMATYYYVVKLNDDEDQQFAGPVTIIK